MLGIEYKIELKLERLDGMEQGDKVKVDLRSEVWIQSKGRWKIVVEFIVVLRVYF